DSGGSARRGRADDVSVQATAVLAAPPQIVAILGGEGPVPVELCAHAGVPASRFGGIARAARVVVTATGAARLEFALPGRGVVGRVGGLHRAGRIAIIVIGTVVITPRPGVFVQVTSRNGLAGARIVHRRIELASALAHAAVALEFVRFAVGTRCAR